MSSTSHRKVAGLILRGKKIKWKLAKLKVNIHLKKNPNGKI